MPLLTPRRIRDQNRKANGAEGGVGNRTDKRQAHVPEEIGCSGEWGLHGGPASDQNLKSFPGGEALATKRGELSPFGVWGIRVHGRPWLMESGRASPETQVFPGTNSWTIHHHPAVS